MPRARRSTGRRHHHHGRDQREARLPEHRPGRQGRLHHRVRPRHPHIHEPASHPRPEVLRRRRTPVGREPGERLRCGVGADRLLARIGPRRQRRRRHRLAPLREQPVQRLRPAPRLERWGALPHNGVELSTNPSTHKISPCLAWQGATREILAFWNERTSNQDRLGDHGPEDLRGGGADLDRQTAQRCSRSTRPRSPLPAASRSGTARSSSSSTIPRAP